MRIKYTNRLMILIIAKRAGDFIAGYWGRFFNKKSYPLKIVWL